MTLHFNGHFSRWTLGWYQNVSILVLGEGMTEMMVTTGAIRCTKLQSNRRHQQTNTQFFTGQMRSCRTTNSVGALKGKLSDDH